MIYAIVSDTDTIQNAALAANIAASRVKNGSKVLLIEASLHMHLLLWNLRRYRNEARLKLPVLPLIGGGLCQALQEHASSYRDIVINVGAANSSILKTALTAANVVIVPVKHQRMQLKDKEALKTIADTVKLLNPHVQMRVLATDAISGTPVQDYAALVALASRYSGASVVAQNAAGSNDALQAFQCGLSIFEDGRTDESAVRGMTSLCRQLCDCSAEKPLARQAG